LTAFHRAELVEALYNGLPESAKNKVLLGKKLVDIKSNEHEVVVTCDDGTSYHGSLALGADGVHSKTRLLMRNLALEENPSRSWDAENPFIATYNCLWSSFPRPTEAGQGFDTHHKDKSIMYLSGRERSWIFLYRKLPEPTRGRVSYKDKDLEDCIEEFSDFPITDSFKVKDVWPRRLTAGMANLEEGVAENWTWGRVVLAGDAAHKFTPNSGQGFNAGIQDVVRLCNGLRAPQTTESTSSKPAIRPETSLTETLAAYEQERRAAAKGEIGRAASTTRVHAEASPFYYFLSRYILTIHLVQYLLVELAMKPAISSSLVLDYVKVDEALKGTAAWKHALGRPVEKAA
jgi:2-polyprenyl-6-methoxyphenol hydroxylase-like FAD-dependent oxidoreductase